MADSSDALCIVGLDAEWQRDEDQNTLLSFQWCVLMGSAEITGIRFPEGKLRFEDAVGGALEDARQQGLFQRYPKEIVLVCHFSLAELAIMADFGNLKTSFDALRGTFTTLTKPIELTIQDKNRNRRQVRVRLRDSMLLTPQGARLETLGKIHDLPKVEIPTGAIENMRQLLEDDRELFCQYAITDAQIAARHARKMTQLNQELTGQADVPITLGGLALNFTLAWWSENGIDTSKVLGAETVVEEVFNEKTGRTSRKPKTVPITTLHEWEPLAVECYHGGRNEAFLFGPSGEDDWRDVDLCGAYSTALASIGMPMWDQARASTDVADYTAGVIGLARVRFCFPERVRFPVMPSRMPSNLIFPREGETHATSPEIELAVSLGARVEILSGVIIPMDITERPFEKVIAECSRRRQQAKLEGDSLGDRLYKELVNSLYGKTAQGLREKRVFDSRTGKRKELPRCRLTQPYLAAFVTGLVRAALGELMNSLPPSRTIVSVTTDGFICNATEVELERGSHGPACQIFRESRNRLVDDPTILEVKHRVRAVLCFRTRGQATLMPVEGEGTILLAKAGIKPPREFRDSSAQNKWLVDSFFERDSDTKFSYVRLRTLREIYDHGGDLVTRPLERRLALDFDFKRKPTLRWMQETGEYPTHLAFGTEPFRTMEECLRYRNAWNRFRQTGRCLKTVKDLRDFEEFLAGDTLRGKGLNRSRKGLTKVAMSQFLRRLVRGEFGLGPVLKRHTHGELARMISDCGEAVTIADLKNAGRKGSLPKPGSIPRTPEVMRVVGALQTCFPEWEANEMLEPIDSEVLERDSDLTVVATVEGPLLETG